MLALKRKLMLERQRKREEEEEEEGGEGEEEVMFCVRFVSSDSFFLFLSPLFFSHSPSLPLFFFLSSFFLQCRIWIQSISLQFTRFRSSQLSLLIPC